jgi:hypothetical protein
MRRRLVVTAILMLGSMVWRPPLAQAQNKQQPAKQKKPAESKDRLATLTGCVDQQEGHYILINDQTRSLIAHLEAEGFPTEGFAKHLGHKVNVRGTSSSNEAERPIFKVRTVESVSDACGPQH